MGLFTALQEQGHVRWDANMRAGQWLSAVACPCTLFVGSFEGTLATLCIPVTSFCFFSATRYSRGPLQHVLRQAMPWIILTIPPAILLVVTRVRDVESAFTNWLPGMVTAFFIAISVLRLEPWRPAVYGLFASALYLASYGLATWDLSPAERMSVASLQPAAQVIRCMFFVGSGFALAMMTRGLRHAIGRAEKKARERELFGKYRLGAPIASGGMGTIVEATYCPEGGFERPVAIKRVHPHLLENPRVIDGFRAEAELGARLTHPNIVAVLDFGRIDDTYFIAMERIHGIDLRTLLSRLRKKRVAIPARIAGLITSEILQGLAFAHGGARDRHGRLLRVVHRDLSPGNVLIAATGEVKVTDFGIACALREAPGHQTRRIVGSMAYLSPEQAAQSAFDHRADLFAVGTLLYEMLTLGRLFKRPSVAATLLAILHDDVPSVSPAWDPFLRRALSKVPSRRFQSAKEMCEALHQVLLNIEGDLATTDEIATFLQRSGALDAHDPPRPEEVTQVDTVDTTPPAEATTRARRRPTRIHSSDFDDLSQMSTEIRAS